MNRRDALQVFAITATTPLLGASPFNHLINIGRSVRQTMTAEPTALRTLAPTQAHSMRVLAEIIIPATETPGANEAGVTDFIDTLLTDWMRAEERDAFLRGIDDLNQRTQANFDTPFTECSESQQLQTTISMDAEVAQLLAIDRAAPYDPYNVNNRAKDKAPRHFFYQAKRWTLVGYFTSEVGMTEELQHDFLPGKWDPCRALEDGR